MGDDTKKPSFGDPGSHQMSNPLNLLYKIIEVVVVPTTREKRKREIAKRKSDKGVCAL